MAGEPRWDHAVIYGMVEPGSRVLDLGCGDGELLDLLVRGKGVTGQGIEVDGQAIRRCVARGLSVFQSDIDSGLPDYPDGSFDYVVLNQSLQEVKNVDLVLREALRVAGKVVVGFPNFAYVTARSRLFFRGKTPMTKALPYEWHDTPNLRFLSISDFEEYARRQGLRILAARYLGSRGETRCWPNLFAQSAVYLLGR